MSDLLAGVRAICFDLDDTLFAYRPAHEAGLRAAHAVFHERHPEVDEAAFRELHTRARLAWAEALPGTAASHSRLLFFKRMAEACGPMDPRFVRAVHEAYWGAFCDALAPDPAVTALLETLAARCPLAAVTNQVLEAQLRKLERLDYGRFFGHVVTSEEAGADKPDPRIFRAALARLATPAERTLMVGDDPAGDVGGARACGMRAVHWIAHTAKEPARAEADLVVAGPRELASALGVPEPGGSDEEAAV